MSNFRHSAVIIMFPSYVPLTLFPPAPAESKRAVIMATGTRTIAVHRTTSRAKTTRRRQCAQTGHYSSVSRLMEKG